MWDCPNTNERNRVHNNTHFSINITLTRVTPLFLLLFPYVVNSQSYCHSIIVSPFRKYNQESLYICNHLASLYILTIINIGLLSKTIYN